MAIQSSNEVNKLFKGFSKLNYQERIQRLMNLGVLNEEQKEFFSSGGIKDISLGEKFIENVIGYFQIPLGVATNFCIDDKDYVIPMAVEETSIIASASKTARWVKENGRIVTRLIGKDIIGQIQLAKVKDFFSFKKIIESNKYKLINDVNTTVANSMVRRGGGVNNLQVRKIDRGDGCDMAVVHVFLDPIDAMGANTINQVCEYLKEPIEQLTNEKVTMCILSNLVDSKITEAKVILKNIDFELAKKIEEASLFAQKDPYRAATNNKGVLNAIDPILIASGNDWRAVEAGIHAYASLKGRYTSITKWEIEKKEKFVNLIGTLKAPIIVGTVGGVTKIHPTARICLDIMGITSAQELSRIIAAVGLVQNLGALRALTTEGITKGHMKLHIKNLILNAGAKEEEIPFMEKELTLILKNNKRVTMSDAMNVMKNLQEYKNL